MISIYFSFCCLHLNWHFYFHCFASVITKKLKILLLKLAFFWEGGVAFKFSGMHRSCNWFSMTAFIFLDSYHTCTHSIYTKVMDLARIHVGTMKEKKNTFKILHRLIMQIVEGF